MPHTQGLVVIGKAVPTLPVAPELRTIQRRDPNHLHTPGIQSVIGTPGFEQTAGCGIVESLRPEFFAGYTPYP